MKMIEDQTSNCVQFIQRKNESNWIYIFNGINCSSNFGMVIGKQGLSLNTRWCLHKHTVVEELVHALGFRWVILFASYKSTNLI